MQIKAFREDKTQVFPAEVIYTFRNEPWLFVEVKRNKVYAEDIVTGHQQEFFPAVFNLTLEEI